MKRWKKTVLWIAGALVSVIAAGVVFWNVSVWPSVWLLRQIPDPGGLANAQTAARLVPDGIHSDLDLVYDARSDQGRIDVFRPDDATGSLPVVFWVHGGGFIAGQKEPLRDYLRILASHGFVVVNVEYTHAPEAIYPIAVRQVGAAIAYATGKAEDLHIDPDRVVIAGDSAGAHIAAQAAMAIAQPDYATRAGLPTPIAPQQLVGTVQFSGPYDPTTVNYDNATFGFFMRTVMWAYSGRKEFLQDDSFLMTALPKHVDADYPPLFVSTGPADPLLAQNLAWAKAAAEAGVDVTTLFFDAGGVPETIGHEYQLALDTEQARDAMKQYVSFLRTVTSAPMRAGVSDSW
ncbi:MAG: hypothetical protein BGN97_05195 [Microbacterium sp. 69-10]|uniref:alpha/beta hydrolase n=1 Tax=Microbacterium sp. 69-10 TaxID=1895783 RepID=UPI00096963B1|nr:alpha/beta hydrolase [Microbacterium sp. 69-10]OJU40708.1 MAG: hypothetical protein BGN97_05195 [Microbacterium sp. 69-10]